MNRPILLLALALATALLVGCGGGEEGNSSAITATTAIPERTGKAGDIGYAALPKPRAGGAAAARADRERAGRAAPFVQPGADNSIPTFGSEAGAGERAAAEAGLRSYLRARAAEDWARACTLLAASARAAFERISASAGVSTGAPSCPSLMPALAPIEPGIPANPLRGALIAFRVHGHDAFALFAGPPVHQQYVVPMSREGGAWRPSQAAPIPYPLGEGAGGDR